MSKYFKPLVIGAASAYALLGTVSASSADTLSEAISGGDAYLNFRLRYENADIDNATPSADALTLRTTLGYITGNYKGFSAQIEAEDVREVFGVSDFSVPPADIRPGEFDIIADPETTEIDQAFLKYSAGGFTAKLGRQVIVLDNQRFIGSVGWRQDKQTFDAIRADYKFSENFSATAAHIVKRNRIFAEEQDFDSSDTLLNAAYQTSIGKFVGYAYLLEQDDIPDNSLDTYGISYSGASKIGGSKVTYRAEYATQDSESSTGDFNTDYLNLDTSIKVGPITAGLGYEVLGSDDGDSAFATPLATLHKFNGFADVFLATPAAGLEDFSISLSTKVFGGTFKAIYHDFSADESTGSGDDLGDEIDLLYTRKFGKNIWGGIKYASYSSGSSDASPADTDRFWLWTAIKFK